MLFKKPPLTHSKAKRPVRTSGASRYQMMLARAVYGAAALIGFANCAEDVRPEAAGAQASAGRRDAVDEDHPPFETCLRRLEATEGAVWIGRDKNARILMELPGADELRSDPKTVGYVAVLRGDESPQVFAILDFAVDPQGTDLGMSLAPASGSGRSIRVSGAVHGNALRFTWMLGNDDGVFPKDLELRRESGPIDEEEVRLRNRLKQIAR